MKVKRLNKFVVTGVVVLGILGASFIYANIIDRTHYITAPVVRTSVVQEVSANGSVTYTQDVDLSFARGGTVAGVPVGVGEKVSEGDTLIRLDTAVLQSQLSAARAAVAVARAQMGSTQTSANTISQEQDTLVANAYRTLLSSGLVAVPDFSSYTATAPTISGSYDGSEGSYRFNIDTIQSGVYRLYAHNLEQIGPTTISLTGPTPLGTHGLFVSFPDALVSYVGTSWTVQIPNTKSSTYAANLSAYHAAKEARDRAMAAAQSDLSTSEGSSVLQAQLQSALASEQNIRTQIEQSSITAPFSGTITRQDAKVGASVNAGVPLVSLAGEDGLEVELNVSENNIAEVEVGDTVRMTLDALGGGQFTGKVVKIEPSSTLIGGAQYYKTTVLFDELPEAVKPGMTVNAYIRTGFASSTLVVPASALAETATSTYVQVYQDGAVINKPVQAGLEDQKGMVEIRSGLAEGELVITGQ